MERIERLEQLVNDIDKRLSRVEQSVAVGDVRFENIHERLDCIERKISDLMKWTQATNVTVGLGVVSALIAWLLTRGG